MASDRLSVLWLKVFDCVVRVEANDSSLLALLTGNYGSMRSSFGQPHLSYAVGRLSGSSTLFLSRTNGETLSASDEGEFLYLFEKDLTVELQKLKSNLYFVHAAALEFQGKAVMLVAASGGAKSLTTWAFLHHGFAYLSDELAPIDLPTLNVYPYPHALCLKDNPPTLYPLPEQTFRTSGTLHVPVDCLPGRVVRKPTPLAAIYFVCFKPGTFEGGVHSVSKAEASARLFANSLNPLAHSHSGLEAAARITRGSSCFRLFTANLPLACDLVKATLNGPSLPIDRRARRLRAKAR